MFFPPDLLKQCEHITLPVESGRIGLLAWEQSCDEKSCDEVRENVMHGYWERFTGRANGDFQNDSLAWFLIPAAGDDSCIVEMLLAFEPLLGDQITFLRYVSTHERKLLEPRLIRWCPSEP